MPPRRLSTALLTLSRPHSPAAWSSLATSHPSRGSPPSPPAAPGRQGVELVEMAVRCSASSWTLHRPGPTNPPCPALRRPARLDERHGQSSWRHSGRDGRGVSSWSEVSDEMAEAWRLTEPLPSIWPELPRMALHRCMRVLPHQNDTGGFFVVLHKRGSCRRAVHHFCVDHATPVEGAPQPLPPLYLQIRCRPSSARRRWELGKRRDGAADGVPRRQTSSP